MVTTALLIKILIGIIAFFGTTFTLIALYYIKSKDRQIAALEQAVHDLDRTVTTLSGWMKSLNRKQETLESILRKNGQ